MSQGQQSFQERLARLDQKHATGPATHSVEPAMPDSAATAPQAIRAKSAPSQFRGLLIGFAVFVGIIVLAATVAVMNAEAIANRIAGFDAPAATETATRQPLPTISTAGTQGFKSAFANAPKLNQVTVADPDTGLIAITEDMTLSQRIRANQHNKRLQAGDHTDVQNMNDSARRLMASAEAAARLSPDDEAAQARLAALETCASDDLDCMLTVVQQTSN